MLNNEEIARVLDEISELLEILEEDSFKVRAYRNAAFAVRTSPLPVAALALDGELTKIKGIGKTIASRIEELVRTGHIAYLDELTERIPASILSLTEIPGIGPKTARLIFETLGIADRAALATALESGALKRVKGIGAKTIQSIKKGLELVEKAENRFLLSEAEPVAQSLSQALAHLDGVEEVHIAGSLRRLKETVGDIDIVIQVKTGEEEAVAERVTALDGLSVLEVCHEPVTIIRGTYRRHYPVEIGVSPAPRTGLDLVLATGSATHLDELRDRAVERSIVLFEGGIFVDGAGVDAPDEETVYGLLGLPVIPPYLREGRGEVAAAARGALPASIPSEAIRGDLHVHSTWSDSAATLEEIAEAALHFGYEYIAVTDHAKRLRVAQGMAEDELFERLEQIRVLNERLGGRLTLLSGVELNIDRDGGLDYDDDILSRFDFVIASVHWGFGGDEREITNRILAAMENPYVHTIGHISGRLLLRREAYALDYETIFAHAAETGTALEINAFPDRLDIADINARRAWEKYGVRFTIGTDSHSVTHLPFIKYGLAVARRAWLPPESILNTLPLTRLREALAKRR
jgi:DNA polymerase (family 10)